MQNPDNREILELIKASENMIEQAGGLQINQLQHQYDMVKNALKEVPQASDSVLQELKFCEMALEQKLKEKHIRHFHP